MRASLRTFRWFPILPLLAGLLPGIVLLHAGTGSPADSLQAPPSLTEEALRVGRAGWSTILSPLHWNGSDALNAGGIVAATAGAFLLDDETKSLVARNTSARLDKVEKVVVRYGETPVAVILSGGLYVTGLVASDRWLRETGLLMGTALVITSVGGQVTKSIIGRARPYTGRGSHFFKVFTFNDDFHSFPSGHTTAAFTVSAVLAARIDNPWATAGLYGLAASTALSRIYSNNHWFSDVVFGGLAASAVGRTLVSTFERNEPEPTGFQIIPQPTGISLVYRF